MDKGFIWWRKGKEPAVAEAKIMGEYNGRRDQRQARQGPDMLYGNVMAKESGLYLRVIDNIVKNFLIIGLI